MAEAKDGCVKPSVGVIVPEAEALPEQQQVKMEKIIF